MKGRTDGRTEHRRFVAFMQVRAQFPRAIRPLITVWVQVRVLLYRGGLVSSAFRLLRPVDLMWDVTRRVLASLRDRHLGLPMMGSGGCGGPICRRVPPLRLTEST